MRPKTLILIISLFLLVVVHVYIETSLFFSQVSVNPIKIFYKSYTKTDYSENGMFRITYWVAPNWTISNFVLIIDNAFTDSKAHFQLTIQNDTHEIDYWERYDNGTTLVLNGSKLQNYIENNPPTMVIKSPIIYNSSYLFWKDIIEFLDGRFPRSFEIKPFLKQTSFDTWEGEILFDGSMNTIDIDNRTYIGLDAKTVSIEMSVPDNFRIQNIENINVLQNLHDYSIKENIVSGETFHLVIVDKVREQIKTWMSLVDLIGFPGLIAGIFLSQWYEKKE